MIVRILDAMNLKTHGIYPQVMPDWSELTARIASITMSVATVMTAIYRAANIALKLEVRLNA